MKHLLTPRALLLASAIALAPAAYAETPADTLVVAAAIDDIISLDPAQTFEFSGNDVNNNTYDRLVDFDPLDMDKGFQPSLAESWEVSEDGLSITFTIRDGVTFHSGNPVRAEDAAWSLQRVVKLNKTPAFILTQFGFTPENVEEKITFDGNKLTLTLDQPYAPTFVLNCLTADVASVIDKETVMSHAEGDDLGNTWLNTNEAGSGAFTLAAWQPNQAVQLAAYEDYWQGAPAMKRIVVRNVAESSAQRLLLEKGDIDAARNLTPTDVESLSSTDGVKIQDEPRGRILYMGLNQKDELLSNPAVIEAMKYLVDYEGITNSFLKGMFMTHQSFLPKGYLGALEEQPWTYDVEKAKQILADAGIEGGTITTKVRDLREYVDVAQALQASMAQAGLTLNIEQMTGAQVLDAYRAREVPIFLGEWGPDYSDPNTNAATFAYNPDNSDEARATGLLAWRNAYAVPEEMNEATVAATLEQDGEKRAQMYMDIQRQYQAEAPIVPLFQRIENTGLQENVQNWNSGGAVASVIYRQVTKGE
ncbi:ABC transporter substrate-binding protein [Paracoccus seriniphilus]|uniref:Peptide/nickel transport system substrate-binding protein n=1 Tax=Paracoccus seriniphilus TaxID=184748 RepID=A0A239PND9_9RHOB|nr:ABC transporter substrate-binding protein [Paracoccus seriniphilus]WCR13547.1 ABC transporter substrate-binding protein [Paracoccus seriniphilus]SNT68869.1 peptide/nickel transport system substrate-binding protein [Paracoccus seriniphilus]